MDGVDFEDLCLDPHEDSLEEGRAEGRIAGLQAGFKDGRSLGRIKGLEIGTEVGYMRGVAVAVNDCLVPLVESQSSDTESIRRIENIRKVIRELVSAIDAFPSPDDMFNERDKSQTSVLGELGDVTIGRKEDAMTEKRDETKASEKKLDISNKLQRIRAKFKLLTVQLKLPRLSLKKVMDEALHLDMTDELAEAPTIGAHTDNMPSLKHEATSGQQDTDW